MVDSAILPAPRKPILASLKLSSPSLVRFRCDDLVEGAGDGLAEGDLRDSSPVFEVPPVLEVPAPVFEEAPVVLVRLGDLAPVPDFFSLTAESGVDAG